jgi:hypothetical protein
VQQILHLEASSALRARMPLCRRRAEGFLLILPHVHPVVVFTLHVRHKFCYNPLGVRSNIICLAAAFSQYMRQTLAWTQKITATTLFPTNSPSVPHTPYSDVDVRAASLLYLFCLKMSPRRSKKSRKWLKHSRKNKGQNFRSRNVVSTANCAATQTEQVEIFHTHLSQNL